MSVSPMLIENGGTNYLTNPGAETSTAGWVVVTTAGFTTALVRDAGMATSGAASFRLDITANTAAQWATCGFRTTGFAVPASQIGRIAGSLRTDNPNLVPYLTIEGYTASGGTYLGTRGDPPPTGATTANAWQGRDIVTTGSGTAAPFATPAGWVLFYIYVRSVVAGSTGSVWADDLHLGVIRQSPGFLRLSSSHIGPLRAGKA